MSFILRLLEILSAAPTQLMRGAVHIGGWFYEGWIRRITGLGVIAAVLGVTGGVAAVAYFPGVLEPDGRLAWRDFERAADRARAIALYDSEDRFIGIVHPDSEEGHLGEYTVADLRELGWWPDHKAVPVDDAPTHFWRCLVYLEDIHRKSWRNPHGVDAVSLAAIPVTGRGGSTLEMQMARSIWKLHSENTRALPQKLGRKWREWRAAPVLQRYLTEDGDERRLRAWAAQHIPLVSGGGGESGSIYGVELSGQYLFGKRSENLTSGEQLLLAAAAVKPIFWRNSDEPGLALERRQAVMARLIGTPDAPRRALRCADADAILPDGAPVIRDEAARLDAYEQLGAMLASLDLVPYPAAFEPALGPLAAAGATPLLDPMRMALTLAPNVQREAVAEIVDGFAALDARTGGPGAGCDAADPGACDRHPWRGRLYEVRLTLDAAKNFAFRTAARNALLDLSEGGLGGRLREGAFPRRTVSEDGRLLIQAGDTPVLIAAADRQGRIVRYYSSANDSVYSGRVAQRPDTPGIGNGPYDPGLEPRQIGSVGKVAAAMLLAGAGKNSSGERVSNACLEGLTEKCRAPGEAAYPRDVTYRQAFGQSLNSPVIRAVTGHVAPAEIDRLMDALGFNLKPARRKEPRATALALGRYNGRPKSVHQLIGLAFAIVRGDDGPAPAPYFIEAYKPFDPREERRGAGEARFDHAALRPSDFATTAYPGFLEALLSEPLCDGARGSLRKLNAWCATKNAKVRRHIGKSGTVSAGTLGGSFNESDWWVTGAIEFSDGRVYTYVASAGAGAPRDAFALDSGGGSLAPLIDALLADLADDAPEGDGTNG